MRLVVLSGIRPSFPGLSQSAGQITHVLLTRSPLEHPRRDLSVRLACVKHAASVRPEPGSNSPNKNPSKTRRIHIRKIPTKQNNHTLTRGIRMRQKQQQTKPPNTLLSSQTTPAPRRPRDQPAPIGASDKADEWNALLLRAIPKRMAVTSRLTAARLQQVTRDQRISQLPC